MILREIDRPRMSADSGTRRVTPNRASIAVAPATSSVPPPASTLAGSVQSPSIAPV